MKPAPPPSGPRSGDQFVGHIRILDTLGVGGMGEVYAGWDEALERRVALKAIRKRHRMRPEVKARFLREARILSQLDHPHICRIYDYVAGDDRDYLVLELVEGDSLGRVVRGGGATDDPALDDPRRLEIAEGIAGALATAHAKGVVHRDLKPANVMLTEDGVVKVLDFGIARSIDPSGKNVLTARGEGPPADDPDGPPPKDGGAGATLLELPARLPDPGGDAGGPGAAGQTTLDTPPAAHGGAPSAAEEAAEEAPAVERDGWTVHGSVLGSPGYLSPEQAHGEAATTASDMYAFGLLLQELFTGRPPFPPDLSVPQLVLRAQKGERLPLEGVRSDVAGLIDELLNPAPAARPTAVQALARIRWIRDKPRRRLIRGAIAAVVLLLVLSGVKYTLDLKAARDEAQLHRAQAEDLIGFMLGDLRDKLEGVGRLELLEDVGDKALDYYESLPLEDRTDDELFRRSKALRQIGEVRIAQGDLPAAMEAFDESEELARALVERDPDRGEWVLGLGHSHYWKGNVHWLQGDLTAALERFLSYGELTHGLVAADPDNAEWRLEEGYAATNLAAVHQRLGQEEEALAALARSLEIKRQLLAADPDNAELQRSLANGLSWQGSLLIDGGDLAAADESFRQEREIRRATVEAEPGNADARVLLAVNASHRGVLALKRGNLETAESALTEARDLFRNLVDHDPENSEWQRYLAVTHFYLADLALAQGKPHLAGQAAQAAQAIIDPLVRSDPTNVKLRRAQATTEIARARSLTAEGRHGVAVDIADKALADLRSLAEESPENQEVIATLTDAHLVVGQIMAKLDSPAEARRHWQTALQLIQPLAESSSNVDAIALLSRSLLLLEQDEEAERHLETLEEAGYSRHRIQRLNDPDAVTGSQAP